MRIESSAKINLHLRIGPLAADGFHPLLSWMCTVGLHDVLELQPSDKPGIQIICDRADVPTDRRNLIVSAGEALASSESRGNNRGAIVKLEKRIPIGGGLGGGSSNAATALMGFNQLWNLGKSKDSLAEIGAKLGSDVPFFFHAPSAVCTGRGEYCVPIPPPKPKFAVLIFPKLSMPTPAVYRRFDEMSLGRNETIANQPDWLAWSNLSASELLQNLVNDLEKPSFDLCPELGRIRADAEQRVGRIVRMSGSGSTLFTLADTQDEADSMAAKIRANGISAEAMRIGNGV
jgi:4-diphosphocytidyl-2-C-methyl-D-erythritol kinase